MRKTLNSVADFFQKLWRLTYPYWISEERWKARGLLLIVVILNLGLVAITVRLNEWNRVFYNALQDKDLQAFWIQLGIFCVLATFFIITAVYQLYLNQMLQIRWRRWLTEHYLDQWFQHRAYYRMELKGESTDNPDQRIAQDLQAFTTDTLSYAIGLMNAIVTLFSFVLILWGLSGTLELGLPGKDSFLSVPGYMVWVALVYSVLGTWLTHKIGFPLVAMNFNLERFQANFRYNLVRFRENAEAIALYHGEKDEKRTLLKRFHGIWETWWQLMRQQKSLMWFTATYGQLAVIFPLLVAAPKYFAGELQLGGLVQTALAFGQVQSSLSWFVTAYAGLASWKASVDRLTTFQDALDQAKEEIQNESPVTLQENSEGALSFENLELKTPLGETLLQGAQATIESKDRILVSGPSGCGKSTLFRTLAGIWPFAKGTLKIPKGKILFLPQKPYLPMDTLKAVLAFPSSHDTFDGETIQQVMNACELAHLIPLLEKEDNWARVLSPGEQQRIAFARTLLQKPDWLFMDEATASLDETTEKRLFETLNQKLDRTAIMSIGHRPSLEAFHNKRLRFEGKTQLVLESI